ncbi:MAG: transporter substrate-binding protein, partial [Deltaproteobacteria bacterium]|nr:transporter substrate-binding protein [Deltaproteobacteria bacterium]
MREKKTISRRTFLKTAAAGIGGATLALQGSKEAAAQKDKAPAKVTPPGKVWKLKLQSNWTGIGITSQDEAAKLFCERVNKLSGGRIEMKNYDADVLLGIGETHKGVGSGVADVAVTSAIYARGIVPVAYYLWAVPFFPNDHVEFMELWYQVLGGKEIWREAYAKQGIMHLTYECSDEWGTMVSTKPIRKYSDFKGLKVRAFGIWADWLVHNGASIVTTPGGEIYMAIQTKILDAAAFGSPDAWAGAKLYEVC